MVEWRCDPGPLGLSLWPIGYRLSHTGFSVCLLSRMCCSCCTGKRTSQQTQSHAVPQPGLSPARVNCLLRRWLAHCVFWSTWFPRSTAEGGRNPVTTSGQDMAQQAAAVSGPHSTGISSQIRLSVTLCARWFCQLDTNLHTPARKESQVRSYLHQTSLWPHL